MKKILAILAVSLLLALIPGAAYANDSCPNGDCLVKVTGGGWCYSDCTGARITFGFNAQPTDSGAKGQFQLIDHTNKINIHAEINWAAGCVVNSTTYSFTGIARVNGQGSYLFVVDLYDGGEPGALNGDYIAISVYSSPLLTYSCTIDGGNIQAHVK